jgi:hypothetical protein
MSDVIELLRKNPNLSKINQKYTGEDNYKVAIR